MGSVACSECLERGVCGLFGTSGTWGLWPVRNVWNVGFVACSERLERGVCGLFGTSGMSVLLSVILNTILTVYKELIDKPWCDWSIAVTCHNKLRVTHLKPVYNLSYRIF